MDSTYLLSTKLKPSRIYHELHGDEKSEPLVLVHGIDSSSTFGAIARHLKEHYRVVLYDQRGHGKTPAIGEDYSLEVMAGDLKVLLDYLRLESVHLLGHSAGGKTALKFAQLFPEKIRSLIVEDIGVRGSNLGSREDYLRDVPSRNRPRKLYEFEALSTDLSQALRGIKEPVLFIFAGNRGAATIKAINPNVKVDCIEGATHEIHASHPATFVNSIRRFTGAIGG